MGLDPVMEPGAGFCLGPWRVLPHRNVIERNGEARRLENRLMQTLAFLAAHPGEVLTRKQFFETVWRGRVVNEEALSRAISLLRSALDDDSHAPRFIQTIPGVGYRLITAVTNPEATGPAAPPVAAANQNSIAVLPFVNLSADPANEYFSDGISEEILNVLTQVERFKVVGRTSSFAFKDTRDDLRTIGRTLNVTHLLEGSVRQADARVRITAQLINVEDGFHVWSETFERRLDDIFAVQDEIASAVTRALKVKLLGEPERTQDVAVSAARKAMQLDPVSVYAAHILGHVLYFARQYEEAIEACHHTLELDPHYPKPHYFAAMSLYWLGRDEEALQEIQQEPLAWMRHTAATAILHRLGRSAEADAHFAALVELGETENNYVQQADIHAQLGDGEQALRCLDQALELGDPGLAQLLVDPFLDPVRDDPRFAALLRTVGLAN